MPNDFQFLRIKLASSAQMQSWATRKLLDDTEQLCEVSKPITLSYRTYRPHLEGLFCEKAFGPEKSYRCSCGRYNGKLSRNNSNVICPNCGVELEAKKTRRRQMGLIKLATPVIHPWYINGQPNHMAKILDMKPKHLLDAVYNSHSKYGIGPLIRKAEAFKNELKKINIKADIKRLREAVATGVGRENDTVQRIRMLESFLQSDSHPSSIIMDYLPVLPPDLRPMFKLKDGLLIIYDLNTLYRAVIIQNNRVRMMYDSSFPSFLIRTAEIRLQEHVDRLYNNSKCPKPTIDRNTALPLKSLTQILSGKEGRFRMNLIGRRVDYSARSVIVSGPGLSIEEVGLPFILASELFRPFIIYSLVYRGIVRTRSSATIMIKEGGPIIESIIRDLIIDHRVLINRAPTLHRYGFLAFQIVLCEGKAIHLNSLVCPGFNADFDGDQIAVHLPFSFESQFEAAYYMSPYGNAVNCRNNEAIATPTQDMSMGLYYISQLENRQYFSNSLEVPYFSNFRDVTSALQEGIIYTRQPIWVHVSEEANIHYPLRPLKINRFGERIGWSSQDVQIQTCQNRIESIFIRTTAGRVLVHDCFVSSRDAKGAVWEDITCLA